MRPLPFIAVLLLAAACESRAWSRLDGRIPKPTEHWLDEEAEERNQSGRERWFEEMHRTAPGVDWRAIERLNGEAEQTRRTLLASGPAFMTASYWTEVGSKNQAGRMHCAVISPDGQALYAGSARGGLWRGSYAGTNWTPLGDNLYGGVWQVVAVAGEHPGDPDFLAVWGSNGIRVTRDHGASWETPAGLGSLNTIRDLGSLHDANNTLIVLGQNSLGSAAVYASTDYGRTFNQRYFSLATGKAAMWIPRTGAGASSTIYLTQNGQLRKSTNGGSSFANGAMLEPSATDAVLCGSEAGAPTLYAAFDVAGAWRIYRSDDAGASGVFQNSPSDFWSEMTASTIDASIVMYGGVEVFRSTNGAASFTKINPWGSYYSDPLHKLHADTMGLYAWPDAQSPNGESVFFCMDGGLWRSQASGASPLNLSLSGLGVGQYYSTLTSSSNTNIILAGAQDQGYQRGVLQASGGAGPSTDFDQLISGDYGHLTSSDGTHALVYSNYPGFTLVQQGQGNPQLVAMINFPTGYTTLWLPPVVADPLDSKSYFLCANKLLRATRASATSTVWNFVEHSAQDFAAGSANYLTAVAFAPSDAQRAYACDDAGRLYSSTDHGSIWTQTTSNAPGEHYFYGNAFAVHPTDPLEAVVGGSGYSTAGVRRTIDGGASWSALTSGLPATQIYDLVYSHDGQADVYAATEAGAFRWERASGQWQNIMQLGTPITTYWSVEFVGTDLARFGTYGRGIWDYHLPIVPPPIGTYCTPKVSSGLCIPAMGWSGTPSASSAQPFDVTATQILANKSGLLFYGSQPHNGAFQGGTLCVKSPTVRTALQNSGGSATCSGAYSYDFNARIQSGVDPNLSVGVVVYSQYWYRDPQDSYTTGLSDGLQFTIQP
jgi:photosystem II stability/assembly factor-like uncharacterized protein